MTNKYKYFIGNWKMFGDLSSFKILVSVNKYLNKIKRKNIKVIFCVPSNLINYFSNKLKNSKILIGAQNCHHYNNYGPYTGNVNSKMIKNSGAKYVILGHSENRIEGDTDKIINKKIKSAIKNNLVVIFCIGETLIQKKNNLTKKILSKQIDSGLKNIQNIRKIIIAYEPVWSIGTGIIPKYNDLNKTVSFIRNKIVSKFRNKNFVKIIYGGSVKSENVSELNIVNNMDGFLIGGASQSQKKFIDIMKICYK